MPWFPDFIAAAELVRREVRADGQAHPVAEYFAALTKGETQELETVWPGEVVIYDPRAGEIRGHKQVRRFVRENHDRWAERHAGTETVASMVADGRAVVELIVRLAVDGEAVLWPLAVVAESPDDQSVVFRTYCSQLPVDGLRHVRGPILKPRDGRPADVIDRYQAALGSGDVDAIVGTFASDGYYREPIGPHAVHRGTQELRALFTQSFSAGGGVTLEDCAITDDGVRCALEYNCVRWGSHELVPQAGIAVFDRRPDGALAAVRVYDDVEPPITVR
jgi:ketosteroid isomerase-like protein